MADRTADDALPEPMGEVRPRRSVARNAAALMLSQSMTWVMATVVVAAVPRFLGPRGQGQLRLGVSLGAVVTTLATFGSATLLTVEVARDQSITRSLVRRIVRMRFLVFAGLLPALALFVWIAGYDRPTVIVVGIALTAAAIQLIPSTYTAAMYGLQEMGATARMDVSLKLVVTLSTIVVLAAGGRVYAISGVGVGIGVLGVIAMRRAYAKVLPPAVRESPLSGGRLLAAGLPFLLADASLVIYQQIDTVVISLLVNEETIGWYATADILFGSVLFVPTILMTAMFPAIAELHSRAPDEVAPLLGRTFNSTLLVAVPIGLGTIVVARSFVDLLYGGEFAETAPVLEVLGVVTIMSCLTILLGRFAIATGNVRFWSALMVISIVISVPLDVVLVPWTDRAFDNGAIGGALAYVVTESFMLVVGVAWLARHLLSRALLVRASKLTVAGGAMLAVGLPMRRFNFLLSGSLSLVVYVLALVALRTLDQSELSQIKRLTRRLHRFKGAAA